MAYTIQTALVGAQGIAQTDTTSNHPLGARIFANDTTYGGAEFVYLKGVASTVVGSVVIYDQYAGTSTLATAGSRGPVAVAMSANVETNTVGIKSLALLSLRPQVLWLLTRLNTQRQPLALLMMPWFLVTKLMVLLQKLQTVRLRLACWLLN